MIVTMIEKVYTFLWGDLIRIPLPGGSTLGISLLILLLIPTGIYFTIRTKLLRSVFFRYGTSPVRKEKVTKIIFQHFRR